MVQSILLNMKGLPKDLYSARLGMLKGPLINEQQVRLEVLSGTPSGIQGVAEGSAAATL
jgi:hypothetical protein